MDWLIEFENATEAYIDAQIRWPSIKRRSGGKWILASFNDESIIVYQAYNNEIAQFACQYGRFLGCPNYNSQRMTWIKTSFLWMMYRSNWATRSNQQRILAIWLHRSAFDTYLARAVHVHVRDSCDDQQPMETNIRGRVRLQWDPDHYPDGESVLGRRAIQLGLKQMESFLDGRDILRIVDITPFVRNQYEKMVLFKGRRRLFQVDQLNVPIANIYEPENEQIRQHLELDPVNIDASRTS